MRLKTTPTPQRVGKDELHFAENPIALLTERQSPSQSVIQTVRLIDGKGSGTVESSWKVTGSEEYGLPISSDMDIYLILMELTREQGFESRTIYFSRYEIVRRLKTLSSRSEKATWGGKDFKRIQDSLNRLVGVTIYATRWYDASVKKYGSYSFHVLENSFLFDETPGRKSPREQAPLRLSYITWDDTFFRNLQAGYVKSLDLVKYFALSSSISKSLFRYLDKRFYDGKERFEIGLRALAHEHLGLSRNYKYDSEIKVKMKKAHEELVEQGIISGYDYRDGADGLIVIYHAPHSRHKTVAPLPPPPSVSVQEEMARPVSDAILDSLVAVGLGRDVAEQFAGSYEEEYLRLKMAYLPYAQAKNPGGWLRRAIEGDWQAPPGYLAAQRAGEKRERTQKVQQSRQAVSTEAEDRKAKLKEQFRSLAAEEQESLLKRAEVHAREKHSKAAELADRGKGIRIWKGLIEAEAHRLMGEPPLEALPSA